MIYETWEPDIEDEYYDEMCETAYAVMFNRKDDYYVSSEENPDFLDCFYGFY